MRKRLNAAHIIFDYVDLEICRDTIKFLEKYNVLHFPETNGYVRVTPKGDKIIISPAEGSKLIMRPMVRISKLERFFDFSLEEGDIIKEGRRTFQIYLKTPYKD